MRLIIRLFIMLAVTAIFMNQSLFAAEYKTANTFVRVTTNMLGYNVIVKKIAQKILKQTLNNAMEGDYKIRIDSFSGVDLKKGKFKSLAIDGENLTSKDNLHISKIALNTKPDFYYVDYKKDPIVFKTELPMDFDIELSESDLNKNFNEICGLSTLCSMIPLIKIEKPVIKILNDKIRLQSSLKMPLAKKVKFTMTAGLKVEDGKVILSNIESSGSNDFAEKLISIINNKALLEEINVGLFDNTDASGSVEKVDVKNKSVYIHGHLLISKSN